MGASQIIRSGAKSGTTPVPYPRSIPPFHTCLKDPFHTYVPYLCSIPLIHTLWYIYIYIYIYIVWFYICTHILERTYIHECVHARIRLLCPSPVIVLASLCLQRYLLCCVMVGMCLAVVSWQSKNGLLVTLTPSQPVAGFRLHHLQLLPAVVQLWCLMVEMCLAVASWQSKNCLLRYSRSKLPILIKMCCVVAELCWSGPFRSRPRSIPFHIRSRPTHVPSLTHFRMNKWQVLTWTAWEPRVLLRGGTIYPIGTGTSEF